MMCYWNFGGRSWRQGRLEPQLCEQTSGRTAIVIGDDGIVYHSEDIGILHVVVSQWSYDAWLAIRSAKLAGFRIMLEHDGSQLEGEHGS